MAEQMLSESIAHFLIEYKKGCTDFSVFGSIFLRLVQKMTDPTLEIAWFYSAMTFHSSVRSSIPQDPSRKLVMAVKDLFQLLVSCSSLFNGLRRVALLAPIVYELYYLVLDCSSEGLCLKGEIEGLVEGIVSYISLCCSNCSGEWDNRSDKLTGGFVDLIRVWTVDRVGEKCEFGDDLRVFFPLASAEVCSGFSGGCGTGYLAGVVMVEAFLLRLCLKFGSMVLKEELQKDMQNWAVQTINGFRNPGFFDKLLKMLLEPSLPVNTLLGSVDEALLREVLYDVVILVDFSFIKSQTWTQLPGEYFKSFALTWLSVADNAVQFVGERCDQTRAMSYIDAFSKSCLPYQLIKWVIDQTGLEEKISRPNVSTPKALIRWLLVLEGRGVRVFDHNILKLHAKAVICKPKVEHETNWRGQDKVEEDQEMVDRLDDAFAPTDCMGHSAAAERRRKRMEGKPDEGETRFKLAKFDCDEDSVGEACSPRRDDKFEWRK